jgi:hypothetical protein
MAKEFGAPNVGAIMKADEGLTLAQIMDTMAKPRIGSEPPTFAEAPGKRNAAIDPNQAPAGISLFLRGSVFR